MTVAVAGAKGVWDAVFILYVVWAALILYQVTRRAGAFAALRQDHALQPQQLFLVMAFGWVFASFLQGIAGFGAHSGGGTVARGPAGPPRIRGNNSSSDTPGPRCSEPWPSAGWPRWRWWI